jgi:hypothetical protein
MATFAELWESETKPKDFTQFPKSRGVSETHKGTDYAMPINTPITANIAGTVRYKTNDPKGYGNAVEIVDDKGNVVQRYAHLNEFSVPNGAKIEPGQVLGKSGNTGRSTGPHLHFEDFQQPKQTGAESSFANLFDSITPAQSKELIQEQKIEKEPAYMRPSSEFKKSVSEMSWEDFKKKSMLGTVVQAVAGDKEAQERIKNAGAELGQNIYETIKDPLHPYKQSYEAIKEIASNPGRAVGEMVKGTVYDPELLLIGGGAVRAAKPIAVAEQLAERASQRASIGAAGTSGKSILNAAMDIASPELKAELKNVAPEKLNEFALTNHLEADQLPKPIRLTEGQATQDANLISKERNERGFKEQFVQRFNEQNKDLLKNAELLKDEAAGDLVNTTSHVADAESLIDKIKGIKKSNQEATTQAYKTLEEANGGKFPVDSKLFSDNALKALEKGDDIEFLPSTIKNKLDLYAQGKEMNFNQFENLRTQIARETRKAQRAEDGNAVHALSLVRQELENLPMPGATAELKQLADKARSQAKYDFELESKNDLYKKVVNDSADTKDFVRKFFIDSKNKDFADSIELLKNDPEALANVRSGVMDYINRQSVDASGNFASNKFAKVVENMDLNNKLDLMFGRETAEKLRRVAKVARIIEAEPEGAFVNRSNSATAAGSFAKQYGGKLLEKIPGVKYVATPINIAKEVVAERAVKKQIEEALKPGAGTQLKDIGKK